MKNSKVLRFGVNHGGRMEPMADGEYIELASYEELERSLEEAKAQAENFKIALIELRDGLREDGRFPMTVPEIDKVLNGEGSEKVERLERELAEAKAKIDLLEAERGNYNDKDALRVACDQIKTLEAELAKAKKEPKFTVIGFTGEKAKAIFDAKAESIIKDLRAELAATWKEFSRQLKISAGQGEEIARLKAEVENILEVIKTNPDPIKLEALAKAALAPGKEP